MRCQEKKSRKTVLISCYFNTKLPQRERKCTIFQGFVSSLNVYVLVYFYESSIILTLYEFNLKNVILYAFKYELQSKLSILTFISTLEKMSAPPKLLQIQIFLKFL